MNSEQQQKILSEYRRENELSHATRDERWANVRRAMAAEGIDIIVTPPNPGMADQFQANAIYLSTISGNGGPVSVVFPSEGEVTVVAGAAPSASFWRAWQSWVTDIRNTRWALPEAVIERLRELGAENKRIGIPGLNGLPRSPEGIVSTGFLARLADAFPAMTITDASALMDRVRAHKVQEERAAVAEAIAIVEQGYQVLLDEARPGVGERAVFGKMAGKLIECGSLPPNLMAWSVGNPFGNSLALFPTSRILTEGEPIYVEMEARSPSGYLGQITRTAYLGKPPSDFIEMNELCRDTFVSVMSLMKPGTTMGEVLAEYRSRSAASKYQVVPIIHARALGEDRPMILFDTQDPAVLAFEIQKNHVFALKVQVRDQQSGTMAFLGESVAIGPDGAIRMSDRPLGLSVID